MVKDTDPGKSRPGPAGWPKAVLLMSAMVVPGAAPALPADPLRPFAATSCAEAITRLCEAMAGSPLVSPAENAAATDMARDQATQLCGQDLVSQVMAEFNKDAVGTAKGEVAVERSE